MQVSLRTWLLLAIALFPLNVSAQGIGILTLRTPEEAKEEVKLAPEPTPSVLESLKMAPSLDYRTNSGISPSVELFGEDSGYLSDNNKLWGQYTVGLNFQSKLEAAEASKLADEFNIQGGDGNASARIAINYQFDSHYQIKVAVGGGYAWVSTNEKSNAATITSVSSEIFQGTGSIGLWLKYFYLGGEWTYNRIGGTASSDFEKQIDKSTAKRIRILLPIADEYYFQIQRGSGSSQVGFTKKVSFF